MKRVLQETISPLQSQMIAESFDEYDASGKSVGKNLYMRGIFIQGGIRNANQRVYPVQEIARAVKTLNDQLKNGYSVMGELSHPNDLTINPERASHIITEMWMDGSNGYGKLKILEEMPLGKIVKTLINEDVKLGVSSRGSGNVREDGSGEVSDFEIITVDIVSQPSAPGAYPTAIYEHLMNTTGGYKSLKLAQELEGDRHAQKYLKQSLLRIIDGLK